MESIDDTMHRVNLIWQKMDDKETLARSFGFNGVVEFVGSVRLIYEGPFKEELQLYATKMMEDGMALEDVTDKAMLFAISDIVMVAMLMGRERERLERKENATG